MECLLPYLCMVTLPHIMVELERMLDYRGVRLARFHCIQYYMQHAYTHYTNNEVVIQRTCSPTIRLLGHPSCL